jgi:DtxR family Mn-dependent transcriptional regulator
MTLNLVVAGAILILLAAGLVVLSAERREETRRRTRAEDALKHLFDQEYRGRRGSFASLGGALRLDDRRLMQLLGRMQQQGLVVASGQEFQLTSEGERVARQVVRAHRLLERYFADEARLPLRYIHAEAERQEHTLTPDQIDELSASLGHPRQDPHGDPIPDRDGALSPPADTPVTAWPRDQFGRITHLEDEPPLAYAQILAEGLRIGQVVRIVESTPERIVLTDGDTDYRLAPAVAANVFLAQAPHPAASGLVSLADLQTGEVGEVVSLDPSCQGFSRRRLMDLGFTPGARLEPALQTFAGDPRGYRVRGTLVALRQDQARQVLVRQGAPRSDAQLEQARPGNAPDADRHGTYGI